MILRNYQEKAVKSGVDFFLNKKTKHPKLIVAPTAAGKSIIISAIASQLDSNVLILQPSVELLFQNYEKYLNYDSDCAIYSSSANLKNIAKVTFATIGSIQNDFNSFVNFKYLIVDECHLYPSNSDSMFGRLIKNVPELKILGLTATPFRLRSYMAGSKLEIMTRSHIYKGFQHIIQIQEIANEYWCPIEYIQDIGNQSILRINTNGSEYQEKSVIEYGLTLFNTIDKWIKEYNDKLILCFVPSISQAENLAQMFGGVCISAKTDKKTRKEIIKKFKEKEIKIVFNVNLLGVGFDFPELSVIIDANPTLSLARYYQKVGRLTRQHKSKEVSYFIDLAGNSQRFGRVEDLSLHSHNDKEYHFFSQRTQLTGRYIDSISLGEDNLTYLEKMKNIKEVKVNVDGVVHKFKDMIMNFGKYKGQQISEIPVNYLKWVVETIKDKKEITQNIEKFLKSKEN